MRIESFSNSDESGGIMQFWVKRGVRAGYATLPKGYKAGEFNIVGYHTNDYHRYILKVCNWLADNYIDFTVTESSLYHVAVKIKSNEGFVITKLSLTPEFITG